MQLRIFSTVRGLWCILGLTALVYAYAVLRSDFVSFDDGLLITKNVVVQALNARTVFHAFTMYDPELYIPLTFLSYQITHALFGMNAVAFHAGNAFLHLFTVAGVYCVARRLAGDGRVAFFSALIFALHPINVETVMWAAARKDALASCFAIFSLLCMLRASDGETRFGWTAATLLFALGLLSKVSVITLPFVFLAIEWSRGRLRWPLPKVLWIHWVLCILFGVIAVLGKTGNLASSSLAETLLLISKSTLFYVLKMVLPFGFSVIYPQPRPVVLTDPFILISLLFLAGLTVVAWMMRKRLPGVSSGILIMALFLAPNGTNFLKNGFLYFASDRYFYLAQLPLIFLVVFALFQLVDHYVRREHVFNLVTLVLTVSVLGMLSFVQSQTWQTSQNMYRNVLANYPDSALALNNLGSYEEKAGRLDVAEKLFRKALKNDPTQMSANINMGNLENERGNLKEAEQHYLTAIATIEKKPFVTQEDLAPYYLLGEFYGNVGRRDDALKTFARAVERSPNNPDAHYNLGLQFQLQKRNAEAIAEFAKTAEVDPTYLDARYHLASLLAESGRLPEAIAQLEEIVKLVPTYGKAAEHLAKMKTMLGQ